MTQEQLPFLPVHEFDPEQATQPVLRQRQYRVVVQEVDHGLYIDRISYLQEATNPWDALRTVGEDIAIEDAGS